MPDVKPVKLKECAHNFIVTHWMSRGNSKSATELRCSHCLLHVSLEQLECQEFKDKHNI